MSQNERSRGANFIKGVAVGAAVGTVLGVLFAPKSGKETRKDISDAASKAKTAAEAQLKKTYNDLGDIANKAAKKAGELKGKAQVEFEKLSVKAERLQAKIRETISSVREGDILSDEDVEKSLKDAHDLLDEIGEKLKKSSQQ